MPALREVFQARRNTIAYRPLTNLRLLPGALMNVIDYRCNAGDLTHARTANPYFDRVGGTLPKVSRVRRVG